MWFQAPHGMCLMWKRREGHPNVKESPNDKPLETPISHVSEQ